MDIKLVYILVTSILVILFIIWNYIGSGQEHKSKNINRIFDILLVAVIAAVLVLGVKVFYSTDKTGKELSEELNQYYEGKIYDEDIDESLIVNYQELKDSEETREYWDNIENDSEQ